MPHFPKLLLVILSCVSVPLAAQRHWVTVKEINGNVYLFDSSGWPKEVTADGQDHDPSLSCDTTVVTFVRRSGWSKGELHHSDFVGDEIWIASTTGNEPPRRVIERSADPNWQELYSPVFSADNQRIYFRRWFGNGSTLHSVDIQTKKVEKLIKGRRCDYHEVICAGEYRGNLIVKEDRIMLAGGRIILVWLCDDRGNYISIIGQDMMSVNLFNEGLADEAP